MYFFFFFFLANKLQRSCLPIAGVVWEGLEEALLERTELPWGGERERQATAENARSRFNQGDWSRRGIKKAKSRSSS